MAMTTGPKQCAIGRIGIVDYDTVETNNLHRQIIHNEESVKDNMSKAASALLAVKRHV
jgi:adenylyltransferase/sulfurtransferase